MKSRCPYSNCQKKLSSKFNLQRHIETCHLMIKKFECKVCFKLFASKQNLQEHDYVHESKEIADLELPRVSHEGEEVIVPKLTDLVRGCQDPSLKPYLHVTRIYPYPVILEETILPAIAEGKSQNEKLPRFLEWFKQ